MQLKIKSQIQVESKKHLEKLIKLFNESNEIFMVEGDIITLYYNMTDRAKDDVDFVTMLLELNDTIKGVVKKKPNTDEEFNKANKALDDIARTIYNDYSEFFKPREFLEFYSNKDPINIKRQCILSMVQHTIDEKGKRIEEGDNNLLTGGKSLDIIAENMDKLFRNIEFSICYSNDWDIAQKLQSIQLRLKKIKDENYELINKVQEYSYTLDKRTKYYSELKDHYNKSTAAYRELNSSYNKLVKENEELKKMKRASMHKPEKEMMDIKLNDFLHSMGLDKEDLVHDILGDDDPIIKVRRLF